MSYHCLFPKLSQCGSSVAVFVYQLLQLCSNVLSLFVSQIVPRWFICCNLCISVIATVRLCLIIACFSNCPKVVRCSLCISVIATVRLCLIIVCFSNCPKVVRCSLCISVIATVRLCLIIVCFSNCPKVVRCSLCISVIATVRLCLIIVCFSNCPKVVHLLQSLYISYCNCAVMSYHCLFLKLSQGGSSVAIFVYQLLRLCGFVLSLFVSQIVPRWFICCNLCISVIVTARLCLVIVCFSNCPKVVHLLQFLYISYYDCAVLSYHCLFLIGPSFGVLERLCFTVAASPG